MPGKLPRVIPINHDDYHAKHVGRTADGRQFFLTTPFVAATAKLHGCEFIALYLFDATGKLLEARIDDLGPRAKLDREKARDLYAQHLAELGEVAYRRIKVMPFRVERFDTVFGLVPREPEEEEEDRWVTVEPGDYMAFHAPWDGDYDT